MDLYYLKSKYLDEAQVTFKDGECYFVNGYLHGTKEIKYFMNVTEEEKNIINYEVYCHFEKDNEEYVVNIEFGQSTYLIYLLLSEEFVISEIYPTFVMLNRNKLVIKVASETEITRLKIKYKSINKSGLKSIIFKQLGGGWLLEPVGNWKVNNFHGYCNYREYRFANTFKTNSFCKINIHRIVLFAQNYEIKCLIKVINNKITICNQLHYNELFFRKEIDLFINFYNQIFGRKLSVEIINCNEIGSMCYSYQGLILFRSELINNTYSFLFQFMFHEIIHQIIGNYLMFSGPGSLWLKESLTEYIQLLYIYFRFGKKVYIKQYKFYADKYKKYQEYDVPILDIFDGVDKNHFMATIGSKGIILFDYIFSLNADYQIGKIHLFFEKMLSIEDERLTFEDFINVMRTINFTKGITTLNKYLYNKGIPRNRKGL